MMHWGYDHGWMGIGWIGMGLFWILLVLAAAALVRYLGGGKSPPKTPLEILQERYARGEIDREEYEQKRSDLQK